MSTANAEAGLPDVSVVIPLYNGAPWIEETLHSALNQTHQPREIVVVDDGSSDGSPELVSAFDGIRLCRREGGGSGDGAGPARRLGQHETSSPLIAFLDQDDVWHPDHLRLLATALKSYPDAPAAVSEVRNFDDGAEPDFDTPVVAVEPADPWDGFLQTFTLTASAVLVRRSALERVGGWTEEHSPSDFYMFLRLSEAGPMLLNECASAARRVHESGHFKQLLNEQTMRYLSRRTQAAVAATYFREAARPEEAPSLERKRDLARGLEGVVQGVAQRDSGQIVAAAHVLERGATGESDVHLNDVVVRLLSLAKRLAGSPQHLAAQQALLIGSWPSSAKRTGRALRRHVLPSVSARHLARGLLRRPLSSIRWRLFTAVSGERLCRLFRGARAHSMGTSPVSS